MSAVDGAPEPGAGPTQGRARGPDEGDGFAPDAGRLRGVWRLVPEVRPGERGRFALFFALAAILNLAQMTGFAGAEALFLGRVGVSYLPHAFILASLVTVLGSLGYAAVVDRVRNDVLFGRMLVMGAVVLAACGAGAVLVGPWVAAALFCLFFLTQAIFLTHFMTFAGDYFDTLAAKRMFPLFTIGSSMGGALGGALVLAALEVAPAESLILAWALGLAASAGLLRATRRRLRRWGPIGLEEADETSVEGLRGALQYLRRSSFSRWLVLSALGMVLALFVGQYLYSGIFARAFPDTRELAAFFGLYLAVTNVLEIVLERFVTPWLIRRVGVAAANLVHPVVTLLSFVVLALDFRLAAAIAARVNREMLENALSNPVRNLVYNAIPMRFRGRMRVFLEGIVIYAGMSLAGLALLLAGSPDPLWLCAIGGATAILYLGANVRVRRAYVDTLVAELRAGRLDLAEVGDELGESEVARLAELWDALLPSGIDHPAGEALELAPVLARRGVAAPLVRATRHANPHVRRGCVSALARVPGPDALDALLGALDDADARVRLAALEALGGRSDDGADPARVRAAAAARLEDGDPAVGAEAACWVYGREPDPEKAERGRERLRAMAGSSEPGPAVAALARLPRELAALAAARARDPVPEVRAAALACLARLGCREEIASADPTGAIGHPAPAVRAAAVDALAALGDAGAAAVLARALDDEQREIRTRASARLGRLGDTGIEAASAYLHGAGPWTVDAALQAVSLAETALARSVLATELRSRVRRAWESLLALQALGPVESPWLRALALAHQDAFGRSAGVAFRILELLEGASLMRHVERALRLGPRRARADALEVIANLGDREAADLLVLLLDEGPLRDKIREAARYVRAPRDRDEVVAWSEASDDRWLVRALKTRDPEAEDERRTMERLLALRQVPLFAHLSLDQLEAINRAMDSVQYLEGEVIVHEGEPGTRLFVLLDGEVDVYRGWGSERPVLLNRLRPVSYLGEIAILDGERRSATNVAARDSSLVALEGERLKELVLQMPEISFEIFRGLISRLRQAERRLEERRLEGGEGI